MPKKPKASPEEIINVMQSYCPFTDSGLLKPRSSTCWVDAASILNISPTTLEAFVRQNRHNALYILRKHYHIEESEYESCGSLDLSSSSSHYSPVSLPSKGFLDFQGELILSWDQWEKKLPFKPCIKTKTDRANIIF